VVVDGPAWGDRAATERDHAATSDLYKTLVDIRFKLLTFVPTVTAVAVGIVAMNQDKVSADQWVTVGAIGFIATMALVVYEVRNSLLHDCAIHRIKHLERILGFRPSSTPRSPSVVETAAGRKPRAIIQTASTISCTPSGSCSKFCAEELPAIAPYIASTYAAA
jgi:hypothetical protein